MLYFHQYFRRVPKYLFQLSASLLLLQAGRAQDPITLFPDQYRLVLDNSAVSVVRVHYGPHEKLGIHDHSRMPTIYVYLSDSDPIRFSHLEEQHPFTLLRPRVQQGAFRVSPGRIERHSVENMGDRSSDFLRVEMRTIPLGRISSSFRGAAPTVLSRSSNRIEFRSPDIEIERVICAGESACGVPALSSPSLLIAFSPARIILPGRSEKRLETGSIEWMAGSEFLTMKAITPAPVHILRIAFLSREKL